MQDKFQPMLLLTVNNSIGNKKNHLTAKSLCLLFSKTSNFSNVEKYVLDTIKTEATPEELLWFSKDYHIPLSTLKYVLSIDFNNSMDELETRNGKLFNCTEELFKDLDA